MDALKVAAGFVLAAAVAFFMNVVAGWWKPPTHNPKWRIALATIAIIVAGAATAFLFGGDGNDDEETGQTAAATSAPAAIEAPEADFNIDRPDIYSNVRYGFSITYPETWREAESENADGVVLTSTDGAAEVRAYGSPLLDSTAIDDSPQQYTEDVKNEGGVISSEGRSQLFSLGDDGTRFKVDAWHIEYTSTDKKTGVTRKAIRQTALDKGREFTVIASARASSFARYEPVLEKIVARAAMKESCISCSAN